MAHEHTGWDYKVVVGESDPNQHGGQLCDEGLDGWELAGIYTARDGETRFVFKRPA